MGICRRFTWNFEGRSYNRLLERASSRDVHSHAYFSEIRSKTGRKYADKSVNYESVGGSHSVLTKHSMDVVCGGTPNYRTNKL